MTIKSITTVEQIDSHSSEVPNFQEWVRIRFRRAKWFEYARRRFDLIPFARVANWHAGPVEINADRRKYALKALLESILLGEFGDGDWPFIAYLPQIIPIDRIGKFPLRLSVGQIAYLCAKSTAWIDDLWAPRDRVAAWCAARDIKPPWLKANASSALPANRTIEPIPQPEAEVRTDKPPFDKTQALGLLIAQKKTGVWRTAPKETETREFLKRHFKGVPNGPHGEIRNQVWPGEIRRGPRKRISTGK